MAKKLLLVDVDCGVDDAQALMVALAAPNVEILGITCCHGNSTIENVCQNVLRVLHVCDRMEVSLVATGPLTNLALAVNMDPNFPKKIKNLFIMGGNMESRGNVTVCGEFNFACDPEAAYVVLNAFDCPTYIATWEFTYKNYLPWTFHDEWIMQGTRKSEFMRKISAHSAKYTEECNSNPGEVWTAGFVSCDSYAMAAAIDESFVTGSIHCGISVELNGALTRGMMVLDTTDKLKKKNKVFVLTKCDLEKLKCLMMAALK
eukprot:XP_017946814.1 PREDICTED: novel protein containing an Inosine-uridine preferring nucleoside hydrolase domain isoform X1 [Xenopus tropicalis]